MNLLSETLRWRVPRGPTQWPGRSSEESRFYWFLGTCCLPGPIIWPFFGSLMLSLTTGMFWAFYVSPDRIDRGTWKIAL
ncbi:hypothetical protein BDV35DRAFT_356808 [Aspergillus flavus]|uniref:Uncharacterized protein n=1 Tax=Aspergillus flavus TaxID=5059 RepID=A0A5N6GSU0_ASPFL|nr:hypothetical protein BDV35DRAFT_356808 [Aspergillus flavus]